MKTNQPGTWEGLELAKGRYRVDALIGEGGMGKVYRGWDANLQTDVVIKVPRPEMLFDPNFAGRFSSEVRSLVALAHPHIVKINDVDEHEGVPFAVMQFLSGGSLEDRQTVDAHGNSVPIEPQSLHAWLGAVADALDFVHAQKYVHRDVKPGNILFDAHDNSYLSDFGVVKAIADSPQDPKQARTSAGTTLGTPNYMAPELVMGEEFDGRVDQYALAVTVYEILSGQTPIGGPTDQAVMVNQTTQTPPRLSEQNPSIPEALSNAVMKGLEKRPEDRYADCADLARAILDILPPAGSTSQTQSRPVATQVQPTVPQGRTGTMVQSVPPSQGSPAGQPGRIRCPVCNKGFLFTKKHAGRVISCTQCQTKLRVSKDLRTLTQAKSGGGDTLAQSGSTVQLKSPPAARPSASPSSAPGGSVAQRAVSNARNWTRWLLVPILAVAALSTIVAGAFFVRSLSTDDQEPVAENTNGEDSPVDTAAPDPAAPPQAPPTGTPTAPLQSVATQTVPGQPTAANQNVPGQPPGATPAVPGQAAAAQNVPGQQVATVPPSATQPLPGQQPGAQPIPRQPVPGQPIPGQPMPGQPVPGQQPLDPALANRVRATGVPPGTSPNPGQLNPSQAPGQIPAAGQLPPGTQVPGVPAGTQVPGAPSAAPQAQKYRQIDHYVDLPDPPQNEEDPTEVQILDGLDPEANYRLAAVGLAEMGVGRIAVVPERDDKLNVLLFLSKDGSVIPTEAEDEPLRKPTAESDDESAEEGSESDENSDEARLQAGPNEDEYVLAHYVVREGAVYFQWETIRIADDDRLRRELREHQELCREAVLAVAKRPDPESNVEAVGDLSDATLIAFREVERKPAASVERILEGRKSIVARWRRLPHMRGLLLDQVVIHAGSKKFVHKRVPEEPEHAPMRRMREVEQAFSLPNGAVCYVQIEESSTSCTINVDTEPSVQDMKQKILASQTKLNGLGRDLVAREKRLASARQGLAAAQRAPKQSRRGRVAIAQKHVADAQRALTLKKNFFDKAQAEFEAQKPAMARFEPVYNGLLTCQLSARIYRILGDIQVEVAVLEPPPVF